MIIMRRFFIILSIFNCTRVLSRAASIDKRSNDLWIGSRSLNDRSSVELKEKEFTRETTTSVEASRRSLASPRFVSLDWRAITSEVVRNQRRKRDAATDDGASAAAAASGFVTYDAARVNEESLRERRILSSSSHGRNVTSRYGMQRRHHSCKNRFVLRAGNRKRYKKKNSNDKGKNKKKKRKKKKYSSNYKNNNKEHNEETTRIAKPLKHQKSFQQRHKSYMNKNFDGQLFVGNRSLELFRRELAAAAANSAEGTTTSRKLADRLSSKSSKEIDDILYHARKRRPAHTSTKLIKVPKISSKYKDKRINPTVSKIINESTLRTRAGHVERKRKKFATNLTPKVITVRNKSQYLDESSSINDYDWQKVEKNFTNDAEDWNVKFKNVTGAETSRQGIPEEIRIIAESEKRGEEDFVDGSVLASIYVPINDDAVIHESLVVAMLSRLFDKLENTTTLMKNREIIGNSKEGRNSLSNSSSDENDDDLCQKWLDSKNRLEEAFLGPLDYLPACPCEYPSGTFYEDKIWDKRQGKYFRWRGVVGESERLDVYKHGASRFCVRSLHARVIGHAAAQHCCYDGNRRLLTRGSSAGTPNFVSPEITSKLGDGIDILPWRLCKGDFTRFNGVRTPNNDNRCKTNPEDEEYKSQMENTKY